MRSVNAVGDGFEGVDVRLRDGRQGSEEFRRQQGREHVTESIPAARLPRRTVNGYPA
jgi:hypothetical protein